MLSIYKFRQLSRKRYCIKRLYARDLRQDGSGSNISGQTLRNLHNPLTFIHDIQHVKNYPEADLVIDHMAKLSGELDKTHGKFKRNASRRESSAMDWELKTELNKLGKKLDNFNRDGKFSGKVKSNVSNLRKQIKKLSEQIDHYWDPQVRERRERGNSDVEREFSNDSSITSTYERHPELRRDNMIDNIRKHIRNFSGVLDHYWDPERQRRERDMHPEDIRPNFWEPEDMEHFDVRRTTEDDTHRMRDNYDTLESFIKDREPGWDRSREEPGWKQRSDEAKENGLAAPKHEGWDGNEESLSEQRLRQFNYRRDDRRDDEDNTRSWNVDRPSNRFDSDRRQNRDSDRSWNSDLERFTDRKDRSSERYERFTDRNDRSSDRNERFSDRTDKTDRFTDRFRDVERENDQDFNNDRTSDRDNRDNWNNDVERPFNRNESYSDRNRDRLNK